MNSLTCSFMDVVALASIALDKGRNKLQHEAAGDKDLFNVFVTDEAGVRTLVRENIAAELSHALVSSANHGASVQGLVRTYEAVRVEAID